MSTHRRQLLIVEWAIFGVAYAFIAAGGMTADLAAIGQVVGLTIGTVLVVHRPANPIGSVLTVFGWGWMVAIAADVGAERLADSGATTTAGWIALVAMLATVPLLWLNTVVLWLIFPDGRPANPRAARILRWSAWYLLVPVTIGVFATPRVLGPGAPTVEHPFLDASLADTMGSLWIASMLAVFVLGFVAIGLLFARVRRAAPIERRQILVVGVGVATNFALLLLNAFIQPIGGVDDRGFLVGDAIAGAVLALSIGVATVRYRLFELGRIVRRSIVYAGLAVVIAAIYVSVVVVVGAYYGAGADTALSILATVAAALVFQPARRELEKLANRLVYGPRAEPQEVLSRFARRAGELTDDELLDRLPELVAQGTAARRVAIWVRSSDGFRAVATWPAGTAVETLPVDTRRFEMPGSDRSLPVFHEGELLGGVSVDNEPGEVFTPAEIALLDDLAGALGVALRNIRLAEDLRDQVAALEASRERLLTAADDARRDLEWSLDSGPLQRLVALKVKLEPVRVHADRLGASESARVLATLEKDTENAIASIRQFAAGVYPPTLESEGLIAAIRAHASTAPFSLDVHTDDASWRLDREVESAVYFTVLEAIQNAAKHAGADTVEVTLRRSRDELSFDVVDDGAGFDMVSESDGAGLIGMADRLDTVGGSLEVESSPGSGTRIVGRVPLDQGPMDDPSPDPSRSQVVARTSMLNDDFGMNAAAPAEMAELSE